ncbi:MAG: hypothetical protein IAE80_19990 [Anaerolinea sp.]|nr:hypothetical protein [Anaerolinea sp.]
MLKIDHALYVHAPISMVYAFWTRFEDYPGFMQGVLTVKRPTWTRLIWHANYAGDYETWEAHLTVRSKNETLAWESVNYRTNNMRLDFYSIAPDLTLLKLHAEYEMLHILEDIGVTLGAVSQRLYGDLVRAQYVIEGNTPHRVAVALN